MIRRRTFLHAIAFGGAVSGLRTRTATASEPPPETRVLRLDGRPSLCQAPKWLAKELLLAEGFADVQYLKSESFVELDKAIARGDIDIRIGFVGPSLIQLDAGDPIVLLAGLHVGCFELFGNQRVRAIRDLKGKTVAVPELGSPQHVFLSTMAAHVGLDPRKDIHWITRPRSETMQLLADGKIDAYLGFPPDPQELRAKKVGHVVVNSIVDRPWSQYFCCLVAGNRDFVRAHPVATKRALRSILKAATLCSLEPERVARSLVEQGVATSYEHAAQTLKEIPYNRWREYNPEDTMRFYALRLHEAGMIKASPQKLIAQGTDWRFLNELKKELKG